MISGTAAQSITFLCMSYLYWLEILSLMRSLSRGIVMIIKLESKLEVKFSLFAFNIIREP